MCTDSLSTSPANKTRAFGIHYQSQQTTRCVSLTPSLASTHFKSGSKTDGNSVLKRGKGSEDLWFSLLPYFENRAGTDKDAVSGGVCVCVCCFGFPALVLVAGSVNKSTNSTGSVQGLNDFTTSCLRKLTFILRTQFSD